MREHTVRFEQDEEGYFVADVPSLRGCHTQAQSMNDPMDRVREMFSSARKTKTLRRLNFDSSAFSGWRDDRTRVVRQVSPRR